MPQRNREENIIVVSRSSLLLGEEPYTAPELVATASLATDNSRQKVSASRDVRQWIGFERRGSLLLLMSSIGSKHQKTTPLINS
jgi:hypothetical protein